MVKPRLSAALVCTLASAALAQEPTGQCDEAKALCADTEPPVAAKPLQKSVADTPLQTCSTKPMTGWFRDGYCRTQSADRGRHVVCAEMTSEFLRFTRQRGNDLSTPRGRFPGLKPGDRWCLCALRWREAYNAGKAPPVDLEATHTSVLQYTSYKSLNGTQR